MGAISWQSIYDANGSHMGIRSSVRDITGRKRMEESLRSSEEKYSTLMNHAADAILIADMDGNLLDANWKAEELFGYPKRKLVGMEVEDLHPEEEMEKIAQAFTTMSKGETYQCSDTLILREDGMTVPVDITGAPIEYAGKKVVQEIFRDITRRKEAEKALRKAHDELEFRVQERTAELGEAYESLRRETEERKRAEEQVRLSQKMKAIGTLSGGIAHDFNNILAGIIGFTEMVHDNMAPESRDRHRLDLVLKGAERGRDLVKQILAFSRQTPYGHRPIGLGHVIEEGLKLLRPLLPSTIVIRSRNVADGDMILSEPSQIHQVLMNLCTNAAQAMGWKGGVMEVSVTKDHFGTNSLPSPGAKPGNYVILTVRDTGSGMKPEVLERVFEPFYTTKPHAEGSGLGLSVVHGIVESHGGFITVESEPGKGSVFRIHFPRTGKLGSLESAGEAPIKGGKECILFVDDEDILVELNRERLTQLGYNVVATTSSIEALEMFKEDPGKFDLVITDYTMPDMTGVDLARKLLGLRADIPIILSTGYNDNISQVRAKKIGIREFLLKPQGKRELDLIIRSALDAGGK